MRHPLLKSHDEVRKRMMNLLSHGLSSRRAGNLIFVCGGNAATDMRPRFCDFAKTALPEFEIFQPEFAMKDYFSEGSGGLMDLAEFETLIGDLSHAIVIFPEAPGSFAETGYFSNTEDLVLKTILVLDQKYQSNDSFVMMGPARKFNTKSKFNPNIELNYENPEFSDITKRINRFKISKTRKFLDIVDEPESYDLFCLIQKIFDILLLATFDDVIFVLNSLTNGHAPPKRAKQLSSILVGAGFIRAIGEYGHYIPTDKGLELTKLRVGFLTEESTLRVEILGILESSEPEFSELLQERSNVL